jgi:tRNA pseudouridine38-40 synthase
LTTALAVVARMSDAPHLTVAGRTDAGVHARGQVCHADLPAAAWQGISDQPLRRLNGVLPHDVRVSRVVEAPPGFDARFSAIWRRYAYRVWDDVAAVDPLTRNFVVSVSGPLDLDAMNEAARALLGLRDFAAFCRRRDGATTVRSLLELEWRRTGTVVELRVVADAFCHGMVRSLVGALLPVGTGRHSVDWPAQILTARFRDPTVMTSAAAGLVLEEVGYPSDVELAEQAEIARRRRS